MKTTKLVCNRPKFYFQNRFSFLAKNVFKFGHLVNGKKMVQIVWELNQGNKDYNKTHIEKKIEIMSH